MRASCRLLFLSVALAGLACGAPGVAAQEVVQALPNPAAAKLAEALHRLSSNPESVAALVDAGRASLKLDDVDAALGFFSRAQRAAPEDGGVLAGLALVALRKGDAVTALQLFDDANLAGEPMTPLAAERGLAYDLVGNNGRAQRLYRQALEQDDSPEVVRRLALSYAIGGDAAASEEALLPLLQRQDRAAFRSRAFALAILGRQDEAVTIAETMLPPRIANRMAPYLRYMGRLTRAQQAAAANLGRFPAASQIGREDPRMAAIGIAPPQANDRATAGRRLIPGGEPLAQAASAARAEQPAPVEPPAQRDPVVELPPVPAPVSARSASPVSGPVAAAPTVVATAQPAPVPPASVPASAAAAPAFAQSGAPAPLPPEIVAESEAEPVDLAAAFAEFADPDAAPVARVADAVDITTIDIPRERPAPKVPPPPVHPTRQWVQVATGQDLAAFRFDWRRLRRGAQGLLDDRAAFHAKWGQTSRLLTGPFDSARDAQQFVSELREAGIDSFRFTSEEGQEVTPLQ